MKSNYVTQILSDYEVLEPDQSDTWNPLKSEFELTYRLSLFYSLTQALALSGIPIQDLRVLDLGCGNGRSTRMYIDLGLFPEQLTGVDLRQGTIERAQKLNPTIRYASYSGDSLPFSDEKFNWISLTTVISSIKGQASRQHLVEQIYQALPSGGYLFYFDLRRANQFAGNDRIDPLNLFSMYKPVWYFPVKRFDFIPNSEWIRKLTESVLARDTDRVISKLRLKASQLLRYSHEALLVQKP